MARFYSISFSNVAVTLAQDLWNVAATASMGFKLHQLELTSENSTSAAELRVLIKRATATVTNGTGGSAGTQVPLLSTDSAATITSRVNDSTTRATTSGAFSNIAVMGWNVLNGLIFVPAPEYRPSFSISQNLIIGLETAPGSSTTMDGYLILEELL